MGADSTMEGMFVIESISRGRRGSVLTVKLVDVLFDNRFHTPSCFSFMKLLKRFMTQR